MSESEAHVSNSTPGVEGFTEGAATCVKVAQARESDEAPQGRFAPCANAEHVPDKPSATKDTRKAKRGSMGNPFSIGIQLKWPSSIQSLKSDNLSWLQAPSGG